MREVFVTALYVAAAATAAAETIVPTSDGATWHYEVRDSSAAGGQPTTVIQRINGKEEVGGKELLKLETVVEDAVAKTELVTVDGRGMLCHQRTGSDGKAVILDPPQTLIPAPLKEGATWEVHDHVAGGAVQRFTIAGEEEVIVAAGSFRAFRAHSEQPWPISTVTDRWYAPGSGLVKEVKTTRGPTGRLLGRTITQLKKFSVNPPQPTPQEAPSITIESGTPQAPAVAASPSPSKPGVLVEISGERDGLPQFEFKSDAPQIFVRWTGVNLPVGAYVRVAWIAEDVGDIAPPNFIVDQTETEIETPEFGARFTLSRPKDGWAAGKYRVELYLDDELLETVKVNIVD